MAKEKIKYIQGRNRNKVRAKGNKEVYGTDYEGMPIYLPPEQRRRTGKSGLPPWQAPDDMPDWMVIQCLAGKMCGQKTRSAKAKNKYCKSVNVIPRANGWPPPFRCRLHGGCATGPGKGTKNALKHGLYCQALLPGEEEIYGSFKVGNVDDEILMTKIRLRRALITEARIEGKLMHSEDIEDELITEEIETSDTMNMEGGSSSKKVKRRLPDFKRVINGCIHQLVKLETQRIALNDSSQADLTPAERAEKAREFLAEAKKSIIGELKQKKTDNIDEDILDDYNESTDAEYDDDDDDEYDDED